MQYQYAVFVFLTALLFGCGGGEGGTSSGQSKPYLVNETASQDRHNFYPHLREPDGQCLENVNSSCQTTTSRTLTRYKQGPGYLGGSFGLGGDSYTDIELDPSVLGESLSTYSGAAATYSAKHGPIAVATDNYVYFVFSGPAMLDNSKLVATTDAGGETSTTSFFQRADGKSNALGVYLGRYNRQTNKVSSPLLLHVKHTDDPHDNAIINKDAAGNIFVLISGRSAKRSALLFMVENPDSQIEFRGEYLLIRDITPDNLDYQSLALTNFNAPKRAPITYPQLISQADGFRLIYNLYCYGGPDLKCSGGTRQLWSAKLNYASGDAKASLTEVRPLAGYGGHYAIAKGSADGQDIAIVFNAHFNGKVSDRTNLYLLLSDDGGQSWQYLDQSGNRLSAETLLPVQSAQALNKLAVRSFHYPGQAVYHRVYVKDLMLEGRKGNLTPIALYVVSSGNESYRPLQNGQFRLMASYLSESGWRHLTLTDQLDHNFSTGALTRLDDRRYRVFFPATQPGNGNALAGGAPAYLDFSLQGEVSDVSYLFSPNPVGQSGYLNGLCEANYFRPIAGQQVADFVTLGSAANPYRFESAYFHQDMAAVPLVMANQAGQWFQFPMQITDPDPQDESALIALKANTILSCNEK